MKSIRGNPANHAAEGVVTAGWAALNTLRDNTVTMHYYAAKERHVDGGNCPACSVTGESLAALALVQAALEAAEKYRRHFAHDNLRGTHHALQCDLAAALRAVQEGK